MTALGDTLTAISMDGHGSHVVQQLVDEIDSESERMEIARLLKSHIFRLAVHENGNHTVQRCLEKLPAPEMDGECGEDEGNQFVYESLAERSVEVSMTKHGALVMNKALDFATPRQRALLASHLVNHSVKLAEDPYGNYVIQHIMKERGDQHFPYHQFIIQNFIGKVVHLAQQKSASNVIETCLDVAPAGLRNAIINELFANTDRIASLIQHDYANYVVQKALRVLQKSDFKRFQEVCKEIKPILGNICSKNMQGRKLYRTFTKQFPCLTK